MSFPLSGESLEMFLSRARMLSVGAVPVYLALLFFVTKEEGWHWSYLVLALLPPVAAVLGVQGKRDILPGRAVWAMVLSIAPLPLIGGLETLF
ncbi:hypothetical protein [Streptomyces beijiangensis]|uniref:Uncharacterized protein n=1 Tax=Streptomyces beijiangensis TaxID=163361 RepID=A0A939FAY5_9ACTN|nr:hypothetical protein [Streptomyces beijiangensis]MBO0515272.1 hypothetical protein [Streptomyces beijiangensis]